MKRSIVSLMVFFSILSYGQKGFRPGFVLTNDSVKITGYIKTQSNSQNGLVCEFITSQDQKPELFNANDIKGYRIENSKYYVSKEISINDKKQRIFLEFLVSGIVDLYYYKGKGNEYYFIEKDGVMTQLSNEGVTKIMKKIDFNGAHEQEYIEYSNQYKRVLQYLFKESPQVVKQIPRTQFGYRQLIEITKDYHNSVCKTKDCIDFTRSTERNIYIEPSIGVINSWLGLKTSTDHVHNLKPDIGVQLRFKAFKGYSNWNTLMGLNFSSNKFQGEFKNTLYYMGYESVTKLTTNYSILTIPLTLEYSFPSEKVQPYISGSLNNSLLLNTVYDAEGANQDHHRFFRKYHFGLSMGFGFRYSLNNKTYILLKNELGYRIPSADLGYVLDKTRVLSYMLNFGIGIKL